LLHRMFYPFFIDVQEVCIFLRDPHRWIDNARIVDLASDLVTMRYETEEEDEISSWEEMVRL